MKRKYSVGFLIGALILAVVLTFNLTYVLVWHVFSNRINNLSAREATFDTISELSAYVDEYYIGDYDRFRLIDGAADGYVDALGDISTYYLSRDEAQSRLSAADSSSTGIGIICSYDREIGGIVILNTYEGSSAQADGLQLLDCITAVDGVAVSSENYEAALEMIRGAESTEVALTVYRQRTGERFNVIVRRGAAVTKLELPSRMIDEKTGYIWLNNLDSGSAKDFKEAYSALRSQGMEKLIIDLRMNPGGYMDEMLEIADFFLEKGSVVYSQLDYSGQIESYEAQEDAESIPLALIINRYTAGGAEYLAAALFENNRASTVGETSAGVAYAQNSIELSDGSMLIISTAQYLTPDGNSLGDTGVRPQVSSPIETDELYAILTSQDGVDRQLDAAAEKLG